MGTISLRSAILVLSFIAPAVLLFATSAQAQNSSTSGFDHTTTGFPLIGTHVYVPCAACHINGRYETTPTKCFGCHNGMTAPGAASLLGVHPVTTNYCEGCHLTTTWRDYRFIDHTQALAPCANCHNGKIAEGKNPGHPITNAACNVCHFNTATWSGSKSTPGTTAMISPAATTTATRASGGATASTVATTAAASGMVNAASTRPDHTRFVSGCVTCHNDHTAAGKPANHVPTTTPCETCHKSTRTFAGARMNHAGIVTNCTQCHNGSVAPGKPPQHIAANAGCETCHKSTMTFAGARVDHAVLTGPCASCHNGVTAEGKPPHHLVTTASCDSCHRSMLWTPVTYRHISPAYVNHGPGLDCNSCHIGNTQAVAWKFPAFKLSCAGCHVDKYRPMQHVKFERPVRMYYTASELRDCASSCHTYADSTMRTVAQRNFSQHRAFGGGW
jgi:hypothetical protein